jgi:hypothetical protein
MVSTIQATQAREGIETSPEQADRAYYVVTEGERAAFFSLRPFGEDNSDSRHDAFIKALGREGTVGGRRVRHDVALQDFSALPLSPLVYSQIRILGPIVRENLRLDPHLAIARGGMNSTESERFVRYHWEPGTNRARQWVRYSKGGNFARFYADLDLVFDWTDDGKEFRSIVKRRYGSESRFVKSPEFYFRRGLTWTEKSSLGLSVRVLEEGAIFNVAGPAAFPRSRVDEWYLLGVMNSSVAAFTAWAFSGRNYGASYVAALPIPRAGASRQKIESIAKGSFSLKANWDEGNETSTKFQAPWILRETGGSLGHRLDSVSERELQADQELSEGYSTINKLVAEAFGLSAESMATLVEILGPQPSERVWPYAQSLSPEQKRLEQVWRLLSFTVKRVVEADNDGIVPFNRSTGEMPFAERVRQELATLFPDCEESQIEVEIVNELKRNVKGYRKCLSLDDWLANVFFEYHASLYKSRPIFWHIASAQGTAPFAFGALVHYHRFDKNQMAKLRARYVRDTMEELRRDAGLADKAGRTDDRVELQARLEEVQALDKKLQQIQEGHHEGPEGGEHDFRILTPWKEASARPRGWAPDLDDGVKVNIAPLDRAEVLRVTGVAG